MSGIGRVLMAAALAVVVLVAGGGTGRAALTDTLRGTLVGDPTVVRLDADDVRFFVQRYIPSATFQASVDAIRVQYRTRGADGKLITASGTILVPRHLSGARPLLSTQHGTTYLKRTDFTFRHDDRHAFGTDGYLPLDTLIYAIVGYVVVAPDYIGYGASSNQLHPYVQAAPLGDTVADMVRAARTVLARQRVRTDGRLFLMGYSEGGYATMAAHRAIEDHYPDLRLTASAPMAGSYDVTATAANLAAADSSYGHLDYLAFVLRAYMETYGLLDPRQVFQPRYYRLVERFFRENHEWVDAERLFPRTIEELIRPEFLASFRGDGEAAMKAKFRENSLIEWTPRAPMMILHCVGDEQVPYANAETAYNSFRNRGARQVELSALPGGSHSSCHEPLTFQALRFFTQHGGPAF